MELSLSEKGFLGYPWYSWLCIILIFTRGVYSSRKSKLFPSAKCRLQKSFPQILPQLQKLQVHFNQGCRSVFDIGGEWFLCCAQGGVWMCPPQKLENFVFETGIVQFDEYFSEQIYSRWRWVKNQFYRPDWPKFCTLGVILVKIVSKNWKSAMFWPKSIDLGWIF